MLPSISKYKIYLYLFFLIFLSSIFNFKYLENYKDMLSLKTINIYGVSHNERINIEKELNVKLDIILTGGFSELISSNFSFKHKLEPNLTLDGIRLIYEDNNGR